MSYTLLFMHMYLLTRHDHDLSAEYSTLFANYVLETPGFANPSSGDMYDDDDVIHPDSPVDPIPLPYHYNLTYPHFMPGGYLNGYNVRLGYLGRGKFNFLNEDTLAEWIQELHGDKVGLYQLPC